MALQDCGANERTSAKRRRFTGGFIFAVKCASKSYCRSEGRWRLEGPKRTPKLMFWRETDDCDGRKGLVVLIGKK